MPCRWRAAASASRCSARPSGADGTEQLTYNGHPLYYFAADTGSGMAKGQGTKAFGAGWYVLNAKGAKIDDD